MDNQVEKNSTNTSIDSINAKTEPSNKTISSEDFMKSLDEILANSTALINERKSRAKNKEKSNTTVSSTLTHSNEFSIKVDDVLYTKDRKPITVLKLLGNYSQYSEYLVKFLNHFYLLRWFDSFKWQNLKPFRDNIIALSKVDCKSKELLFPKEITRISVDGSFGCLFEPIPQEYYTLEDIIKGYIFTVQDDYTSKKKIKFKSIKAMVTAGINLANAFKTLHKHSLCFHSLDEKRILFNINDGSLILDLFKEVSTIDSPEFVNLTDFNLAPEVLNGKNAPNIDSDNHTLSVLLFKLFFHSHPLEGREVIDDCCISAKEEVKHYADTPKFIFNPNDNSNHAVRGVHYVVISMWQKYPQYLKDAFIDVFCDGLKDVKKRYSTEEWLSILLRLKSDILTCVCGRSDFSFKYELTSEQFFCCQRCGSKYHSIKFLNKDITLPIYNGNVIYYAFVSNGLKSVDDLVGVVIENKVHANLFGLKNVSKMPWACELSNGNLKNIGINDILPIFANISIDFGGSMAKFDAK